MPFSNPVVGGTALVRTAINSPNYQTGVAGWSINQDGTAEFNNANIRGTLSLPDNVPGHTRIVIQQAVPASIANLNRANVYPTSFAGGGVVAAILFYNSGVNSSVFSFLGLTSGGFMIRGIADDSTNTAHVVIEEVLNFVGQSLRFTGVVSTTEIDAFATFNYSGSAQSIQTQGQLEVNNVSYWGRNDGHGSVDFNPFSVAYRGSSGVSNSASLPLGRIPSTSGAPGGSRFFLTANVGPISGETVIATWIDGLGGTGISNRLFPVFAGRAYAAHGTFTVNGNAAGNVGIVKVREQVGASPNLGADPLVAWTKITVPSGGNGAGPLVGTYVPGVDKIVRLYVTLAFQSGGGTTVEFNTGGPNEWWLADEGMGFA